MLACISAGFLFVIITLGIVFAGFFIVRRLFNREG